jgi:hypothetical protein
MLNKLTATLFLSAGLALSPLAGSAAASPDEPSSEFTTYWSVSMWGNCAPGAGGRNWDQEIDFAGAPLDRDLIFLNQSWVGAFPRPGIHLYELEPERWEVHFRKLARDLERRIPEDYTGIVVIDYERWKPVWERTRNVRNDGASERAEDYDFLLDWRDAIRETRRDEYYAHGPDTRLQYVYDTYDEMALRFYVETLRECKRLRPNAQWSVFNFPQMRYHSSETPRTVIGYGDGSYVASRINDRMQELFDEMDVIVPSIYPQAWTVSGNNFVDWLPRQRQNRDRANEEFIESMVAEAQRLAHGKPVYPIVSLQYYMGIQPIPWLNEINIRQAIEVSRDSGAAGLIFWGAVTEPESWDQLQTMLYDRLSPALIELVGPGEDSGDPKIVDNANLGGPGGGRHNTANGKSRGAGGDGTVISSVITVDGD